jgi:hypothetical protein
MPADHVRPIRGRAAAFVAVAVGVGAALGRSRGGSRAVATGAALLPLGALAAVRAAAARRADRDLKPAAEAEAPMVVVLVPAKDEAAVIGGVLADLAAQDTRPTRIVVIDDGSTDGTGEVARAAIARHGIARWAAVTERRAGPSTKGAALAAADLDGADLVIVLDADARIGRDFISRALGVAAPGGAATARRRMMAPPADRRIGGLGASLHAWLARVQDDEQTVDGWLNVARRTAGGTGELRGNGMVLSADALRAAGGWSADALCEDLEVSTRLGFEGGGRVDWQRHLDVWEQPVLDPTALVGQRLRWAEGAIRRDLRFVWPSLGNRAVSRPRRLDAGLYAAHTLGGLFGAGLWLGGRHGRRAAATLGIGYLVAGFIVATHALGQASPDGAGRGRERRPVSRRAVDVVLFGMLWPLFTGVAWLRLALRSSSPAFAPTRKWGGFAPPVVARAATPAPEATSPPGAIGAAPRRPHRSPTDAGRRETGAPMPVRASP